MKRTDVFTQKELYLRILSPYVVRPFYHKSANAVAHSSERLFRILKDKQVYRYIGRGGPSRTLA